jgi:hypothetical protein
MSRDPKQPLSMHNRNFVQRLMALMNQKLRPDGLRAFKAAWQSEQTPNTSLVFHDILFHGHRLIKQISQPEKLWHVSLETNSAFFSHNAHRPQPWSPLHLGPFCKPEKPSDYRSSPSTFSPIFHWLEKTGLKVLGLLQSEGLFGLQMGPRWRGGLGLVSMGILQEECLAFL